MTRAAGRKGRQRGTIDELPSGALRVRVYAGVDPVTKKRHDLVEIIPSGPRTHALAEAARVRFVNQVYEQRNPRTSATVAQLIDRYLAEADLETTTVSTYRGYVDKHVMPFLGHCKVGSVDADMLDSFYVELRRCRDHCDGGKGVDHRTTRDHDCDERCCPHVCRPLGASAIRQIHFILSGAFKRAVRWRWVAVNPIKQGEPPAAPKPNPKPPTPEEAARIVNEAWKDPDWGTLVWLTMVTGVRRGELCAIRWRHLDLSSGVLHVERSIGQRDGQVWEKDIKTHQQRRITLDADTLQLLREHRTRCEARAAAIGAALADGAFVYSRAPDGSTHLLPNSVTYRYGLLARRLGIETTLHKLRHYSATELLAGGADVRTVAGRLGHGSGGVTTLRFYAAWVSEADQRAAGNLAARMPPRPTQAPLPPADLADFKPSSPYEDVAVSLRTQILDGSPPAGLPIPPVKQLAREHGVSVGTAQRAVEVLKKWGLVEVNPGRRNVVRRQIGPGVQGDSASNELVEPTRRSISVPSKAEPLDLEIRKLGQVISTVRTVADPADHDALGRLLGAAVKRNGDSSSEIDSYEMVVRQVGKPDVLMTFVAAAV